MLNKMGVSSCTAAASRFSLEVEGVAEMAGDSSGGFREVEFSPYCGGMVIKLGSIWSISMNLPTKLLFEELG